MRAALRVQRPLGAILRSIPTRRGLRVNREALISTSAHHTQVRGFHTSSILYAASSKPLATSGIVQFKLADVGEGIAECEILKWHAKVGATVKEFDPLCEVQSDKATVEITSRFDGVITKLYYKQGDMAQVGSPLIDIDLGGPSSSAGQATDSATTSSAQDTTTARSLQRGAVNATPAVRHLAKVSNIDLSLVKATGRDGRVLKEDILLYLQNPGKEPAPAEAPKEHNIPVALPKSQQTAPSSSKPSAGDVALERVVPISGIRRVMARTMTAAASVPHFGYCDEFTLDALQHVRAVLKPKFESKGIKLSYMPFFIKAASLALTQYPTINSTINHECTEITLKGYHNIGVAMDTPHGLVVPNIKNVQQKSIMEIAEEIGRLHKAAVSNALTAADMTGGTFTLSNIGTIGGTYASPVLLLPEVAIGAIGKISKLPRFDAKGNVVAQHIMQVSWSADHRVIDGASMANFSNLMKLYVEKPEAMLAELR